MPPKSCVSFSNELWIVDLLALILSESLRIVIGKLVENFRPGIVVQF